MPWPVPAPHRTRCGSPIKTGSIGAPLPDGSIESWRSRTGDGGELRFRTARVRAGFRISPLPARHVPMKGSGQNSCCEPRLGPTHAPFVTTGFRKSVSCGAVPRNHWRCSNQPRELVSRTELRSAPEALADAGLLVPIVIRSRAPWGHRESGQQPHVKRHVSSDLASNVTRCSGEDWNGHAR